MPIQDGIHTVHGVSSVMIDMNRLSITEFNAQNHAKNEVKSCTVERSEFAQWVITCRDKYLLIFDNIAFTDCLQGRKEE